MALFNRALIADFYEVTCPAHEAGWTSKTRSSHLLSTRKPRAPTSAPSRPRALTPLRLRARDHRLRDSDGRVVINLSINSPHIAVTPKTSITQFTPTSPSALPLHHPAAAS